MEMMMMMVCFLTNAFFKLLMNQLISIVCLWWFCRSVTCLNNHAICIYKKRQILLVK